MSYPDMGSSIGHSPPCRHKRLLKYKVIEREARLFEFA